ncbi:hypothetical protein FJ959_09905 [Mesorhizobium sp. B2-2-4]|uniref:hypothetical protein n=1 Tax=unclassified Mesorhizobium TaxID=325217 RepID=UPI0011262261|nr:MULTISPECIES: hypothetical protein [unclassified Mesorhizobium]TPM59173.1 hypothetical protein FJ959_09905 [Mesorhizobium sp. B2-2-4]TPM67658.1 hypothetical protein FJ965_11045 [Mesorhizobium sp. B2-2-1]TPN66939.1 hypothetical protein FJ984_15905 [Mesorhizobium sp. B1-1-3]
MNSPTERREVQLQKAEKVRDFLGKTDSVKDLATRATLMHDRVADSVRDICAQENDCFNDRQITILADIAIHVALLMDPSQKKPKGLWGRFWYEFRELSMLSRVGALSGVLALGIGLLTMGAWSVSGIKLAMTWMDKQSVAAEIQPGTAPKAAPTEPATK